MTFVYLICFLLSVAAVFLFLGLTPDTIANDLMVFVSPEQTFRDKVLISKGKKKSRKLTVALHRIREKIIKRVRILLSFDQSTRTDTDNYAVQLVNADA
ncbi:MAG TPA: hypothetical protein PLT66_08740, partial [Bacillota bacterium]|nr:hypothetical protein [Bacillota bacterium]